MLVLSHPRSGSTEICRIAELCFYTPYKGVISLGEFFNPADRTSFGNLQDAFQHFRTNSAPTTVSVLVVNDKKILTKPKFERFSRQVSGKDYLDIANITFNSAVQLTEWFYTERRHRLDLINSFKSFYSIKHIMTLFDNDRDIEYENKFTRELIMPQFDAGKFIFSYRRNLIESVFSGLIKTFYFDKARINSNDNKFVETMADDHNLNDMPVLKPQPIRIINSIEDDGEFFQIDGIIITNLMLLEFYHNFVDKLQFNNIICYEDIMETKKLTLTYQGKTQAYNINDLPPRIVYQYNSDGTRKELIEKKMNYGDYTREDYFTNSHIVRKVIDKEVNKIESRSPGFKQTLEKLGIIR
jgi:hypothetical protein